MLAQEMRDARFVVADSPFELRFRPARLTKVIESFLADRFADSAAPEFSRLNAQN